MLMVHRCLIMVHGTQMFDYIGETRVGGHLGEQMHGGHIGGTRGGRHILVDNGRGDHLVGDNVWV